MARTLEAIGRSGLAQNVGQFLDRMQTRELRERQDIRQEGLFKSQQAISEQKLQQLKFQNQQTAELIRQQNRKFDPTITKNFMALDEIGQKEYLEGARQQGLLDDNGLIRSIDADKYRKELLDSGFLDRVVNRKTIEVRNRYKAIQDAIERGEDFVQVGENKIKIDEYKQRTDSMAANVKQGADLLGQLHDAVDKQKAEAAKQDKLTPGDRLIADSLRESLGREPTAAEIVNKKQQLKGKGVKMTLADGTVVEVGGGRDLTPPVKTQLQKDVVNITERMQDLKVLKQNYRKSFLTYPGRLKRFALREASKLGIELGPEGKEFLAIARQFQEGIEQAFNAYRKEITGAQAAIKEIEMLRDSILNKKLAPDEFEASVDRYMSKMQRGLRLKRMLLNQGVIGKDFGKTLDTLYKAGDDVPDSEIDIRGDELKNSGMTDQEVIEQLRSEGYNV